MEFKFFTDTAELAIFDPNQLKHKIDDPADWWTVPSSAINEINSGNAIFIDLGVDGKYKVIIQEKIDIPKKHFRLKLKCSSGQIYIGPGEDTVGEGLVPDESLDGELVNLEEGVYWVIVSMGDDKESLLISFASTSELPSNNVDDLLRF